MSDPSQSAAPPAPESLTGFNALLGFRLTEWRDGFAQIEFDIAAQHLNRSGILHGGVLATVLDAALGYAGVFPLETGGRRRAVTLSIAVSFLGQAKSGRVRCLARRRGGGRTIFMAEAEAVAADGSLLATAQAVYRYIADAAPE